MKKLILVILALGALYHFKPELFSFDLSSGAFDNNGNPVVLVFTSKNCGGYCAKGLQELKQRQVPFTELPLDNKPENQQRYQDLGQGNLPYIVIGKNKVAGFYRGMMASALAQNYGEQYLNRWEKQFYQHHFYEDGSPLIYMYGASWCPYCQNLRQEFKKRDMDYVELDVDASANKDLISNIMNIEGFPVVYVGYRRVPGGAQIDKIIDAIKLAENKKI